MRRMKSTCMTLTGFSFGCLAFACSNAVDSAELGTQSQGLQVTDDSGLTWDYVGSIRDTMPPARDETIPQEELSPAERAELLRPYMILRGELYRLSNSDLDGLLEKVENSVATGTDAPQGKTSLPAGAPGTVEEDMKAMRFQKRVFGSDNRTVVGVNGNSWPLNIVGTLQSPAGVCTVYKAYNHHTAVSARHRVYKEGEGGYRPAPIFQFGPHSPGTVYAMPSFGPTNHSWQDACYAAMFWGGDDRHYDYVVFKLRDLNLGLDCGFSNYNVGFFSNWYTFSGTQGVLGYPGDPPGAAVWPALTWHEGSVHSGESGKRIDTDNIDTTEGQSGSPYYRWYTDGNMYVTGTHSGDDYQLFDWENRGPSVHQANMWQFVVSWAGN